jgi:hypothetical protein
MFHAADARWYHRQSDVLRANSKGGVRECAWRGDPAGGRARRRARPACGPTPPKRGYSDLPKHSELGRCIGLRRVILQISKLQLQLLQQRAAFGRLAKMLVPQLLDRELELLDQLRKPALDLSDIVRPDSPRVVITEASWWGQSRHGHWSCSAAPSSQAPTPHRGAPKAWSLTANARTERSSSYRDTGHRRILSERSSTRFYRSARTAPAASASAAKRGARSVRSIACSVVTSLDHRRSSAQ